MRIPLALGFGAIAVAGLTAWLPPVDADRTDAEEIRRVVAKIFDTESS